MDLTSDQQILWQYGFVKLNGTIATTWAMIIAMGVGSNLVTRRLATEGTISRWQGLLEIVITSIEKQIQDVGLEQPEKYISFLGTLFLFVATAALCTVIPGFKPPTGSLSTTAALALAVRLFGNMMSGVMIVGILLTITPFLFPIMMTMLGLLTGMVQAYIFSILAAVYIAAATLVRKPRPAGSTPPKPAPARK